MHTDFVAATQRYETWLRSQVSVVEPELDYKHREMASKKSAFPFFRGTYYRWAEVWPFTCEGYASAPRTLSVGDLHVENFGTWRDREGRLVWGVNDLDEVEDLPFTNDLVRLAASAILGAVTGKFHLTLKSICRSILTGYVLQLRSGGQPFVLEEVHPELRALAMQSDREPVKFWKKFKKNLSKPTSELSDEVKVALLKDLPGTDHDCQFRARLKAGMGSLGKPRFVALTEFMGSLVAREAKALTPPSTACLEIGSQKSPRIRDVLSHAVRCTDPIYRVDGSWVVRRLAPRCSRIELDQLDCVSETLMFASMGAEAANIHLGTPGITEPILNWLKSQDGNWLANTAGAMIETVILDWKVWRKTDKAAPVHSPKPRRK
jgi:hypothetical protein